MTGSLVRGLGSKTTAWLALITIAVAMLLSVVSAADHQRPHLYARQQQGSPGTGTGSPGPTSGTVGGGGSTSTGGNSPVPAPAPAVASASASASAPEASSAPTAGPLSPLPSSTPLPPSRQPGSTGGTIIGTGGTTIGTGGTIIGTGGTTTPPSSYNLTLPPGATGGTVIGSTGGSTSIIDPRRPVSRLSMIQPKQNTANPPLFAVGSNIVFEWVFDNTTLIFPPANLTVEVNLTGNIKVVWPIANVSGTATSVVWNTATASNPNLFMGFYTL
ncbi:hypothetical protein BGZ99_001097 [Dissophora globulifera]|uniref:DUF7137 domain-containing protein n=1 Tax=Dissophora globulifera TaxID=979702 RepID=A0A9P6UX29_9FUNG|nr:hypothetical protein BGZ99_001097 [Dissophora globulifera]